jgi:hypothetical protein
MAKRLNFLWRRISAPAVAQFRAEWLNGLFVENELVNWKWGRSLKFYRAADLLKFANLLSIRGSCAADPGMSKTVYKNC